MNRKQQTPKEKAAKMRESHLKYLEEITSLNQLSVGDAVLALCEKQLPDP